MPVTLPPLERVPWWGFLAAALTPVVLVGGWLAAGAMVRGYDPVRSSVSDLAAVDSPSHWLMTTALVLTGLGYATTAVALRPADGAGRGLLFVGGVGVLLTAWIPNATVGRNSVGHMIVTYLTFIALSVWPAVIARNRPDAPLVLRRRFGQVVAITLGVLVLLTVAEIVVGGATLGLRERVLTTAQAVVPLVVALGCRSRSEPA
jgi:hypothetical membrane protein